VVPDFDFRVPGVTSMSADLHKFGYAAKPAEDGGQIPSQGGQRPGSHPAGAVGHLVDGQSLGIAGRLFLLLFALPYGLSFVLLWWTPPWRSQVALAVYRMFFNLLASLITAVAAPAIVDAVLAAGATQQRGYLIVSALFGGLATIPLLLIFAAVRERIHTEEEIRREHTTPIADILRTAWANVPFRFATAIYMLNWITFDLAISLHHRPPLEHNSIRLYNATNPVRVHGSTLTHTASTG